MNFVHKLSSLFSAAILLHLITSNLASEPLSESILGDVVTTKLPKRGENETHFEKNYRNWKAPQAFNHFGQSGSNSSNEDRIYNGVEATPNQFPWTVWILVTFRNGDEYFCGGVIIHYENILTAAQCIYPGDNVVSVEVVAGDHDMTRTEGTEQLRTGASVTVPTAYNPNTFAYDIGFVELTRPFTVSGSVDRVALAHSGYPGSAGILTVAGWGSTSESGDVVPRLRKANMTGITNSACSSTYQGIATIRSDMMCARGASGGSGSCMGDGGGPLMCYNEAEGYFVCGIVSFAVECRTTVYPHVFQRMSSFVTWIRDVAGISVLTAGQSETTTTTTTTRRTTMPGGGGGCNLTTNFAIIFISVILLVVRN